jgi:hypothetical protein
MSTELTIKDHAVNVAQGLLKGVPHVGASLEHFVFGPLQELRMRRIETTLGEVANALGPVGALRLAQERFVTLLESITPSLSRSTDETKRACFRDLLRNAGELDQKDPKWSEAELAARLLDELESPALAILAAIARCAAPCSNALTLTSRPTSQVFEGEFNYDNPGGPQHLIPYDWIVVEYWARMPKEPTTHLVRLSRCTWWVWWCWFSSPRGLSHSMDHQE